MKVILFGATGMVGQGVLRECLLSPEVSSVLSIGRSPTGKTHSKLSEIVHADLLDVSAIESQMAGFDACFFCLGVSSVGVSENEYRRVTFDLTMAVARTLVRLNPAMTFIYVSGAGTDSSERGRLMWARVKGETENALLRLPFKEAVMFRPGLIVPLHGIHSKTFLYRLGYSLFRPFGSALHRALPKYVTTTEQIGRAMLRVVGNGVPKPVLETRDINSVSFG